MARRTVLTSRQRSALFALPQREADLLRHYTLSDEDLQNIGVRRRPRNKLGFALQPARAGQRETGSLVEIDDPPRGKKPRRRLEDPRPRARAGPPAAPRRGRPSLGSARVPASQPGYRRHGHPPNDNAETKPGGGREPDRGPRTLTETGNPLFYGAWRVSRPSAPPFDQVGPPVPAVNPVLSVVRPPFPQLVVPDSLALGAELGGGELDKLLRCRAAAA